ncbi:competence/damage-inducible protein A [Brevibacillus laterosporus]|uniref:competence/damage-inducible protein A n=1 Tax=Brevibacillus laterosporus TaxID=1465 RepID=UPI00264EE62E|nr:competence/damage-inducible protein A [Brevibacillus laterosporus]MDN9011523.1 competence/damage-inducible protein A [Brevibacillus laterosporus]MDO0942844.1 competence/damage-inducible protein A [Brevibacillus laterosporus]
MKAEIIAVGTELLLGQIANTNAQFLSQKLAEVGINVYYHITVGDNYERMLQVIERAKSRSDLIIFTGGLGPTQDDLTKDVVADHLGHKLVTDEKAMANIRDFFERRGIDMTDNNRKQALVIEGSTVFDNDHGMAPGMGITQEDVTYVLLPGPPSEMYPMVENYVMPFLASLGNEHQIFHSRVFRFFGIGESLLEAKLIDLIEEQSNPTIAPYAKEFEVTLRITARAASVKEAERLLRPVEEEIRNRVGEFIYAVGESPLHQVLYEQLLVKQQTIAFAESCTGGTVSQLLTSVPGASQVYRGGIVCYSNEIKHQWLDVPLEVLETEGAVSETTARLLAENIRQKMGTTYGVSVTGVAGPESSEGKPVGLVYIGIASEKQPTLVKKVQVAGQRRAIIGRVAKNALYYALQQLHCND